MSMRFPLFFISKTCFQWFFVVCTSTTWDFVVCTSSVRFVLAVSRVQSCHMSDDEEYYLEPKPLPMCIALMLRSQSPLPPPVNKQLTANMELAMEYLHFFQRSETEITMKVPENSSWSPKDVIKMLLVSDSSLFMHFWFGMFFLVWRQFVYAFLVWHVFLGLTPVCLCISGLACFSWFDTSLFMHFWFGMFFLVWHQFVYAFLVWHVFLGLTCT